MRCFRALIAIIDRADTAPKIGLQLYHHSFVFKGLANCHSKNSAHEILKKRDNILHDKLIQLVSYE